MMRRDSILLRQIRPYYNLPSKNAEGRRMTGFLTPYRHWMWKQNELWRNVHEAQFEHLRKVYKRQWLESFRVNADEYIYKYNITKAAQLAQWEYEMHAQEKKRRENQQLAQGRQALKKKHLDLLREYHERQFFYWFERASERLQYMMHIPYINQDNIHEHIERELNKYVVGSKDPYPLNFVGQMPLLEDGEGNISEVHASLITNHVSEGAEPYTRVYEPPSSTSMSEEKLLQMMISAQEEELSNSEVEDVSSTVLEEALEHVSRDETAREGVTKVARSEEETESEREVSRRAYIDRGKIGSKTIFRRPKFEDEQSSKATDNTGTVMKRRKSKLDRIHALQQQQDAQQSKILETGLKDTSQLENLPKRGEIGKATAKIKENVNFPSLEELEKHEYADLVIENKSPLVPKKILDERVGRTKAKKRTESDKDEKLESKKSIF